MILIKIGGGKNINWDYIAEDIAKLDKKEKIIVIHGASETRDKIALQLKTPTQTVTSPSGVTSVFTDQNAIDVFLMAYAGLVNKKIVVSLQKHGVNAIGLSGIDGKLWLGKHKNNILIKQGDKTKLITGSLTGRVEKINTNLLHLLLSNNYTPVLCPPALSYDNVIINCDNDWATAILAGALDLKTIVVLFEAPGMLKNYTDENTIIPIVDKTKLFQIMPFAQGRMKKKIIGAQKAFELGVQTIYWGDGRIKNPIINLLSGKGTIIR